MIAVIIPTHNRKELLLRAIKSLYNQTNQDWMAYIVDDCSNDDTISFLNENGIVIDNDKMHYHKFMENQGVNKARNYALNEISKQDNISHITLLDDDDYFLCDYIENMSRLIDESSYDWIISKCIKDNGENITNIKQFGYIDYMDYLTGNKVSGDATMLINTKFLNDIRFTNEYKNGLEWTFFLELSTQTKPYVVDVSSKVVKYLEDGLSNSKNKTKNKRSFQKKIFKKLGLDYYLFLSKKHQVSYSKHKNIISYIKSMMYMIQSKIFNQISS